MKVLFFASLREKLNCSELEIDSSTAPETLEALREQLKANSNEWSESLSDPRLLVAVNQEMISGNQTLQPNDEIAFFPPVTGG